MDFQATSEVDVIERGKPARIHLYITNKSDQPVTVTELAVSSSAFNIAIVEFGNPLPTPTPNGANGATQTRIDKIAGPFQTLAGSLALTPNGSAPFGQNKLILTLNYSWQSGQQKFESAQPVTVSIEIRRRFEEEAKGLPGGTAAFLYLLLPILPFLFTYQVIDRRRKHEGWNVPTFGSDHIVPAFFLAVLFSLLVIRWTKNHQEIDYSRYEVLLAVIFGSAIAGAIIPSVRWLIDCVRRAIYDFKDADTGDKYLLRALRSRHRRGGFEWAKGTVDTEAWEGILFHQLDGTPVLGATLQIAKVGATTDEDWKKIKIKLFGSQPTDAQNATQTELLDPKYLRKLVKEKKVSVGGHWNKVKVAAAWRETYVVVNAVKNLKTEPGTSIRALVCAVD